MPRGNTENAALIRSCNDTGSLPSISIRITPNAWRRRANGSLSPVGCCPMPNMPASTSSLSASASAVAISPLGQRVACKSRPIVLLDRVGHARILAVGERVVAPHDALKLGEFADHAGDQIGLRKQRGAVGKQRIGTDHLVQSSWPAHERVRRDRAGCRVCCGRRRGRAAARGRRAWFSCRSRRRSAHQPVAGVSRADCPRRCSSGRRGACSKRSGTCW